MLETNPAVAPDKAEVEPVARESVFRAVDMRCVEMQVVA